MMNSKAVNLFQNSQPQKPRIIVAATGSVASIKFGTLAQSLCEWAEVKAVATKSALQFIDQQSVPKDCQLYTDNNEWGSWSKIGDDVLHVKLRHWADAMVIAPLSGNTLAKIASGLCDNLLTCIVRAWDFNKPLFVAPAMNTCMWTSSFTRKHLDTLNELGVIIISPTMKLFASGGDYGDGAMAEPSLIDSSIRFSPYFSRHSLI